MSFGIWAPGHPGDLDLHLAAWPSFLHLSSPLVVQETMQILNNESASLPVDVQAFVSNVFNVVSVLRLRGRWGPSAELGTGIGQDLGLCSTAVSCLLLSLVPPSQVTSCLPPPGHPTVLNILHAAASAGKYPRGQGVKG